MKLIIHADDFGMTKPINDAILELCQLGTLSSTSAMANMPYVNEISKIIPFRNISLGLHSTFTQGKPLSDPMEIPSLVDTYGNFVGYPELVRRLRKKMISVDEIVKELRQQYLFVYELIGDRLVFLDSHHSIHNKFIPFRKAFITIGNVFKIPIIRTRQLHYFQTTEKGIKVIEPDIHNILHFGPKKVISNYYCKYAAYLFSKSFRIPDGMIVDKNTGTLKILHSFLYNSLSINSHKLLYIVVHPATAAPEAGTSKLTSERVDEYNLLKSDEFAAFTNLFGLTNFGQL